MKWQDYYDRFWEWEESTQLNRISSLTDFTSSAEVAEIAVDSCEDNLAMKLVKRALSQGVRFSPEEIIELSCLVDEDLLSELVQSRKGKFNKSQFKELECLCCNEKLLQRVAKEDGHKRAGEDFTESDQILLVQPLRKSRLFGEKKTEKQPLRKNHRGSCDGNCDECPAHYGYRYGRWYYGHHHSHGCEFGGNDCSGGW